MRAEIKIDQPFLDRVIPPRKPESHKDDYGRVLAVCGSTGYTGAAFFAAQSAVYCGSGVVTLAVPQEIYSILAAKLNEPVVQPVPCEAAGTLSLSAMPRLLDLMRRADALLIGCGIGRSDAVRENVLTLLQKADCPVIVDADGINALGGHTDILRSTAFPTILTPHRGEFARLCGLLPSEVTDEIAAQFASQKRCILALKSHRTAVFTPEGACYRNTSGNPGMAKGGSGDVLAGAILSLCGQGLSPLDAACAGVYLHGMAGDLCANRLGEYGMTPSDLLTALPLVLRRYNTREW